MPTDSNRYFDFAPLGLRRGWLFQSGSRDAIRIHVVNELLFSKPKRRAAASLASIM